MRRHPGHVLVPARPDRRADPRADRLRARARAGRSSIEYTDDPHPRNTYWEMWGQPMFDLRDAAGVMHGGQRMPQGLPRQHYIRLDRPSTRRAASRPCGCRFIVQPAQRGARLPRSQRTEDRGPQHPLHDVQPRRPKRGRWPTIVTVSSHEASADTPATCQPRRDHGRRSRPRPSTSTLTSRIAAGRGARRARSRAGRPGAGEAPHPRDRRLAAGRASCARELGLSPASRRRCT